MIRGGAENGRAVQRAALVAPLSLLFIVGFVAPLGTILRFSLNRFAPLGGMQVAFSGTQYAEIFTGSYFITVILRSFEIALIVVVCDVILAYPLALAIARGPRHLRMPLVAAVILPLLVSVVVRTFGWEILLGSTGPIATVLGALLGHPVPLIFNMTGIVVGLAQVLLPFMTLSLVGSLTRIDPYFEEAAASLGAGPFRVFWRVTFPLTIQGLLTGTMLVFTLALSAFVTPEVLGGGKVGFLTGVIYDQATSALNWPLASALGVILLAITLAILGAYSVVMRYAIGR